ncbi:hypothetical protein [Actinomadura sp. 21ATH]|uniref:hypothetical protein n=1 Tax=Actinomadura sp. 21ATH TaxID=1735444 RepID=UPI0035C23C50
MPKTDHEMPLEMVRERPALVPELLRTMFDIDIPAGDRIFLGSETLNDCDPAEYRCDATVMVGDPLEPDLGVICEVQMRPSKQKSYTWPVYMATLRARRKCPVILLVLCPDRATAMRCAEGIDLGHPDWVLNPLVLNLADMPPVTDVEQARRAPELAILGTAAAREPTRPVLEAFCAALEAMPADRALKYHDHVASLLSSTAEKILEDILSLSTYEFKSEFARRHRAEGRAEGEANGEVKSLLIVLAARGLEPSADQRARIESCDDLGQLEVWLKRAVTAESVGEVLG